jgi:hypothetical protein
MDIFRMAAGITTKKSKKMQRTGRQNEVHREEMKKHEGENEV